MTYFKCVSCRVRLYGEARPDSQVRDLCPDCGGMLDPVGELVEVVGYRSIGLRSHPMRLGTTPTRHGALIDRFLSAAVVRPQG